MLNSFAASCEHAQLGNLGNTLTFHCSKCSRSSFAQKIISKNRATNSDQPISRPTDRPIDRPTKPISCIFFLMNDIKGGSIIKLLIVESKSLSKSILPIYFTTKSHINVDPFCDVTSSWCRNQLNIDKRRKQFWYFLSDISVLLALFGS